MVSWVESPGVHSYGTRRLDNMNGYKSPTTTTKLSSVQKGSSPVTSKRPDYQRIPMHQSVKETCCCGGGGDEEEQRCYHRFHNKAFCVTILSFFFLLVSGMILCYTYVDTDWKVIRAPAAALMGLWLFVFLITGLVASQLQVIAGGVKDCMKSLCQCCCKKEDPVQDGDLFQSNGLWHGPH